MKTKIKYFKNLGALSETACTYIVRIAKAEVKRKGYFTMAVSGGTAPIKTYRLLAKSGIPWKSTYIFWQDDRFVSYDGMDSNVKLIYDNLISKVQMDYEKVFPVPAPEHIRPAARAALVYELIIRKIFRLFTPKAKMPSIDLIIAGVGPDGHTASLFPGDKVGLSEKNAMIIATKAPKGMAVRDRVTMTLPFINNCGRLLYIISGKGKAGVIKEILAGNKKYPAAMTKAKKEVIWFIDKNI
jgi:6-phosphogluconolactonase